MTRCAGRMPWLDEALAPNGYPVRDNWHEWFGSSRVVDRRGEPLLLYHGSRRSSSGRPPFGTPGNTVPDIRDDRLFFVTPDVRYADRFTDARGVLTPLYARIENPVDLFDADQVQRLLEIFNSDPQVLARRGPWNEMMDGDVMESAYILLESKSVISALRDEGHDGAFIPEDNELDVTSWAVLEPWQVKAPWGNNGNFSRSPCILDSLPEPEIHAARKVRMPR